MVGFPIQYCNSIIEEYILAVKGVFIRLPVVIKPDEEETYIKMLNISLLYFGITLGEL
jgi:hypothetical protein